MTIPSWINRRDLTAAMELLALADEDRANTLFDAMKKQTPEIIDGPTFFAVIAQFTACLLDSTKPGSEQKLLRQLVAAAAAYHQIHKQQDDGATKH